MGAHSVLLIPPSEVASSSVALGSSDSGLPVSGATDGGVELGLGSSPAALGPCFTAGLILAVPQSQGLVPLPDHWAADAGWRA